MKSDLHFLVTGKRYFGFSFFIAVTNFVCALIYLTFFCPLLMSIFYELQDNVWQYSNILKSIFKLWDFLLKILFFFFSTLLRFVPFALLKM